MIIAVDPQITYKCIQVCKTHRTLHVHKCINDVSGRCTSHLLLLVVGVSSDSKQPSWALLQK